MNIKNVLHVDYWFGQPFGAQGVVLWLLLGVFLFCIVAGLVMRILSQYQEDKFKKIILRRCGNIGMGMGFVGMLWMFFRQEGIAFFSWRIWLLLWAVVGGWRIWGVKKYASRRIPDMKNEEENRARIEKYLPKSKNK